MSRAVHSVFHVHHYGEIRNTAMVETAAYCLERVGTQQRG